MADTAVTRSLQVALDHHRAGRLPAAEALYREILERDPDCVEAIHHLGVVAHQLGNHTAAVELIRRAAALAPDQPGIHSNLGEALRHLQQFDHAVASFRQALALQAKRPDTLNNLGLALGAQGRSDDAIACFRQAIALQPGFGPAHYNLAAALVARQRLDEAVPHFRLAAALDPGSAELQCNLGSALARQGRLAEAFGCFRRAIALRPDLPATHNNLGSIYKECGQLDDALPCYERALALAPGYAEAQNNLGLLFMERGQIDDALAAFRRACALAPDRPDYQSNVILGLLYHPRAGNRAVETELRLWQDRHASPPHALIRPCHNDRSPDRPLRVGYVSSDFRLHAVAFFLLPLLEAHDRAQFEVVCYATDVRSDDVTARFKTSAAQWRSLVGLAEDTIPEMIRQDRIDILVDLAGHMAGRTLRLFASKPAPLQVSYLGFPGSTGLATIDYRLTDALADPPGPSAEYYSEQLVRLPATAWCFTPLSGSPQVAELPAARLGYATFGCFNNFIKVTDEMLAVWARILHRAPRSRLLLKNQAVSTPSIAHRLQAFFVQRGIAADRLEFVPPQPDTLDHLRCHHQVDVALDTFPYHGTTTTCEALWMGVPVVTLAGQSHAARVGVSLLTNVGLQQFITESPDAYAETAVAAVEDPARLAALRAGLRERMRRSPLMDAPRFARAVETAYRTMWRQWCAQPESPEPRSR